MRSLLPSAAVLVRAVISLVAAAMFAALPIQASAGTPDAALDQLLSQARSQAASPGACAEPGLDRLVRAFCKQQLRVGVREYYPLFGVNEGGLRKGYDVDVARRLARTLDLPLSLVRVNAATRIALLADDTIDLTIATMGHNTQRDTQARFIRPHYYRSETVVVGPRNVPVAGLDGVVGRTICVTIGNGSNAQLASQGARLMLFDEAGQLASKLDDETCTLAAQDDSFFAFYLTDPAFAARFNQKFGFAQVPWGMAVAKSGTDRLARAFDLISQIFHRDGVFLEIARANRIGTTFLEQQQAVWTSAACNTDTGSTDTACVLPVLNASVGATSFAPSVKAFEGWVEDKTGFALSLPMLQTEAAWQLFKDGIVNSLILVATTLLATLLFTAIMGAALGSGSLLLRWPARAMTVVIQSSPIVLTLVIAGAIAHAMFPYSPAVALGAATVALGLTNGSNAGQAVSEAMWTLRTERGLAAGDASVFRDATSRAATQIVSFLINAAKGTPVASFIGTPELLSALTDITSFSASGRGTTYSVLLVFYLTVVALVVWLCGYLRSYLERRPVPA